MARARASILLVDNMPLYRDGLSACLKDAGYEVVGQTGNGDEAIRLLNRLRPHLVMMDTILPRAAGFAICREMRLLQPDTPVLLMTSDTSEFDQQETQAIMAGAAGLLPKSMTRDECLTAVKTVLGGLTVFRYKTVEQVARLRSSVQGNGLASLTPRERQVLNQIVMGRTNRDIGRALGISIKTVEKHVTNILGKCHLPTRTAAAILALQSGLAESELAEDEQ
jgi:DNA-binding NarL/FixJ family response regulator